MGVPAPTRKCGALQPAEPAADAAVRAGSIRGSVYARRESSSRGYAAGIDLAELIENRVPAIVAERVLTNERATARLSLDRQRYKVLLSFREDFLPAVEGWKSDVASLMRGRLRLLPMSGDQAFDAVHKTAPHLARDDIALRIVNFVAASREQEHVDSMNELAVEPALLSLVCHGLNERRKEQRKSAFDDALLQGTGRSIVEDFYRGTTSDLPEHVQRFIANELITGVDSGSRAIHTRATFTT